MVTKGTVNSVVQRAVNKGQLLIMSYVFSWLFAGGKKSLYRQGKYLVSDKVDGMACAWTPGS